MNCILICWPKHREGQSGELSRRRQAWEAEKTEWNCIPARRLDRATVLVYFPQHHLLYASDTLAINDDGTLYDPELMREVVEAVEREGLR